MAPGRTALLTLVLSSPYLLGQPNIFPEEVRARRTMRPRLPSSRSNRTAFELTVTVRDSSGKAVGGLTAGDFELLDAGQPKTIQFFSEQRWRSTPSNTPDGSNGKAPSEPMPDAPARSIALFFDDTHTDVAGLHRATLAAERLVSEGLAPGDRVALFTDSGAVTLDFTSDSAVLLVALRN